MQRQHGAVGEEPQVERRALPPGLPAHDRKRHRGNRGSPEHDGHRRQVEPAAEQSREPEEHDSGVHGGKRARVGHGRSVAGGLTGTDCAIPARERRPSCAIICAATNGGFDATVHPGRQGHRRCS